MSRFIPLPQSVTRCRPEAPLTRLHVDCGLQDRCARRIAANTNGDPTKDFSKLITLGGTSMVCGKFIAFSDAATATESHEAKTMQEPE